MTTPETLLIFRIAGIACAVPAESVGSIVMPPDHLTHPPGSGRSTPGIFHHADATYSVIDLPTRFGIDTPRRGAGRLLLQTEGIRHFAFLVDEVVGLVRSEEGKWADLPPYLPHSIFWSGFLYRKEIVLCTELGALRTMHDAAPLHRHIEAIQQQAREQEAAEKTPSGHASSATTASESEGSPVTRESPTPQKPAPSTATTTTPRSEDRIAPAAPARSTRPAARAEADRPLRPQLKTRTETSAKPQQEAAASDTPPAPSAAASTTTATPPPRRPTVTPREKPHTAPARPEPPPPPEVDQPALPATEPRATQPSSGLPLLPLFLLLILLALPLAYWFWLRPSPQLSPSPVTVARTAPTPAPAVTAAAPVPKPEPAPEPETAAKATADNNMEPSVAPTKSEKPAAPLTIERDAEGTINLIIDREAILASTRVPAPPLPAPESGNSPTTREAPPQAAGNSPEGTPAAASQPQEAATEQTTPAVSDGSPGEPPLEPEPDWPKPAVPTGLEPCDCTHIVVPGDTLWDIAERYTGNAFNYPELARRSGITNPDLIYPGDKVRIIIR